MVATKDHHVDPGDHWAKEPDFVDSWPVHCRVGTEGEAFHPNLDPQPFDAIFRKGEHAAAYSGFEGRTTDGHALADRLRGAWRRAGRHLRDRHRLLRARHGSRRPDRGLRHPGAHRDVRGCRTRDERGRPRRDAGRRRHSGLSAASGPSTSGAIACASETRPVIGRIITRNSLTCPDSSSETKSAPSISRPSTGGGEHQHATPAALLGERPHVAEVLERLHRRPQEDHRRGPSGVRLEDRRAAEHHVLGQQRLDGLGILRLQSLAQLFHHSPSKSGARRSANALMPSAASWVDNSIVCPVRSRSSAASRPA